MKTLKESGVPFGARCVFRLQHLGSVSDDLPLQLSIALHLPTVHATTDLGLMVEEYTPKNYRA